MVTVEEPFPMFRYDPAKPKLALDQRQLTSVLAVAEPADLLLIIRLRMLVPQKVEGIKDGLGSAEYYGNVACHASRDRRFRHR